MKSYIIRLSFFLTIGLLMFSCGEDNRDWNVDTSGVSYAPVLYRLDQKMFSADTNKMTQSSELWSSDLGEFYHFYIADILKAGHPKDPTIGNRLNAFVSDSVIKASYEHVTAKFADHLDFVAQFTEGMKKLKFHFETLELPDTIIVYHSVFSNGVLATQSQIAVGLEMYLGADDEIVQLLPGQGFPKYFKDKMDAQFIPTDMARSWIENHLYLGVEESSFADIMIEKGKILYLIHAAYPNQKEWLNLRFTSSEWDWLQENEYNIWQLLVSKKYVFSKDPNVHRNFFTNGPFTVGLGEGAPALAGEYMGYVIVKSYMNKNPDVTLDGLLNEKSVQKIMNAYEVEE